MKIASTLGCAWFFVVACTPRPDAAPAEGAAPSSPAAPASGEAAPPASTAAPPASTAAPPAGPGAVDARCAKDEDCVISTFPGCCPCPQHGPAGSPHAVSARGAREEKEECRVVLCDPGRCAHVPAAQPTEPASFYRAQCKAGTCVAQRVGGPLRP